MTTQVQDRIIERIEAGEIKEASTRIQVPAGGTESFVVKSPASNDEKTSILGFTISNTATFTLDFYEGVTVDTNGNNMLISNSKSSEPSSTSQVLEYGGTYTGGTKKAEDLFAAGTKNSSSGSKTNDIRRIVSGGDAVQYEFTNQDGSNSQLLSVKIIFFEKNA